jgi:hypothetical protein
MSTTTPPPQWLHGLDPESIEALARVREDACVSLYVPASPQGAKADLARIELKDRLRDAVHQLEASGSDEQSVAAIVAAVNGLLEDPASWRHQWHGLAVLVSPTRMLAHPLPVAVPSSAHVSDRFHLTPLIAAAHSTGMCLVLALAQDSVRIVAVGADGSATALEVPGLPKDLRSATALDVTGDREAYAHLRTSEDPKLRMLEYSRAIDRALREAAGVPDWPLVIAAAEPLASIYRSASTRSRLLPETIQGNPEALSDHELALAAAPLLDRRRESDLRHHVADFDEQVGSGHTVTDLSDVARAATEGAIRTLFFDGDALIPGRVEADGTIQTGIEPHAGGYCIVDEVVRRALLTGAMLVPAGAVPVPGGGPVAAILRYTTGAAAGVPARGLVS